MEAVDVEKELDRVMEAALTKYKGQFDNLNEEQRAAMLGVITDSFLAGAEFAGVLVLFQAKNVH